MYLNNFIVCFFVQRPTVLCKIVGVYQIGVHNKVTGKRSLDQVAVMQNIFYKRRITKIFDLKGSLRGRFASQKEDVSSDTPIRNKNKRTTPNNNNNNKKSSSENNRGGYPNEPLVSSSSTTIDGGGGGEWNLSDNDRNQQKLEAGPVTLLDGDFLEFTMGRPMPLTDRARAVFQMSILNVRLVDDSLPL